MKAKRGEHSLKLHNELVVIVGIESSGKTTFARELAERLGCVYYPEIGQECRQRAKCAVYESCEPFDELVMRRELERDEEVVNEGSRRRVLEQWHLGNIAYSRLRSPMVAGRYLDLLRNVLAEKLKPKVIFLELSVEEMVRRKTQQGKPVSDEERLKRFYADWVKEIERVLRELGLEALRLDAGQPCERLCDLAIEYLAK